jgi:PAS domain S-box-containing protein
MAAPAQLKPPGNAARSSGPDRDAVAEALLEATGSAVLGLSHDRLVLFANAAARDGFRASPGTALGEVAPELAAEVTRALAGEPVGAGSVLRRGGLTFLPRITPIRAGGAVVGALCTLVDTTAAEAAARQMRSYAELTREQDAIINSTSEGLWICDAGATVLRVNPASERLNQIRAQEVVGRNMRDLVAEGIFDRSATLEVIRTRQPVNMLQSRRGRTLLLSGVPVLDDAGELIRVVVNEKDLTEIDALHRQLEEQEAIKDRFRHQMLEMQLEETESQRFIARSPCMQRALRQAIKVAAVESTVLLLGESGVGKGLIAELIHKNSSRARSPLIKINCGAIPESLVEAELFGYEKGAFTGAQTTGKAGYFEVADGGILFLDEVAELPLSSQVKLLRFLEDGRVTRVGGTQGRQLDVRILAATHRDLRAMVDLGAFRLDLYYRLNVIPLHIPPLRQRTDCILPALRHYIDRYSERLGVRRRFSRAASEALLAYSWPGNMRELMNVCERLAVMTETEVIERDDLPSDIAARPGQPSEPGAWREGITLAQAVEETERALLLRARKQQGSQTRMAETLGVDQSTVARKLKRYGIE